MFLLCSDGLYNDVDDTDIASVLASGIAGTRRMNW
jgi:protein phosphatase